MKNTIIILAFSMLASCTHDANPTSHHYLCTEYDTSLRYQINWCLNKDSVYATNTYESLENEQYHATDSTIKHNGGTSYKTPYTFDMGCTGANINHVTDTITHGKKVVCDIE